jgi:hypothetical protein
MLLLGVMTTMNSKQQLAAADEHADHHHQPAASGAGSCQAAQRPLVPSGVWTQLGGAAASQTVDAAGSTLQLTCSQPFVSFPSTAILVCVNGVYTGPGRTATCLASAADVAAGASGCDVASLPAVRDGMWAPFVPSRSVLPQGTQLSLSCRPGTLVSIDANPGPSRSCGAGGCSATLMCGANGRFAGNGTWARCHIPHENAASACGLALEQAHTATQPPNGKCLVTSHTCSHFCQSIFDGIVRNCVGVQGAADQPFVAEIMHFLGSQGPSTCQYLPGTAGDNSHADAHGTHDAHSVDDHGAGHAEHLVAPPGCESVSFLWGCYPWFAGPATTALHPDLQQHSISKQQMTEMKTSKLSSYMMVLAVTFVWEGGVEWLQHARYSDPRCQFQAQLFGVFLSEVAIVGVVSLATMFYTSLNPDISHEQHLALEFVHIQIFLGVAVLKTFQMMQLYFNLDHEERQWRAALHDISTGSLEAEVELQTLTDSASKTKCMSPQKLEVVANLFGAVPYFPSTTVCPRASLLVYKHIFFRHFQQQLPESFDFVAYIVRCHEEYCLETAEIRKYT